MEARLVRVALVLALGFFGLGASHRTPNFIISASSQQFAREVGDAAEAFRRDLAIEWIGRELPRWSQPCPIRVQDAPNLGAGGMTSFVFVGGQPNDFQMSIQGSRERIIDSVLPHEITHTIFATHFGRPLPRWADEGACTTVEHESEKDKQHRLLYEFLTTGRGIAFNQMFAMKEYPRDILPLYAQGFSLSKFFIAQGGKRKFMEYVGEGMNTNNWPAVTAKFYGFKDLSELQNTWVAWVSKGCPAIQTPTDGPNAAPSTILVSTPAGGERRDEAQANIAGPYAAPTELTQLGGASQPRAAAFPLAAGQAGSALVQLSGARSASPAVALVPIQSAAPAGSAQPQSFTANNAGGYGDWKTTQPDQTAAPPDSLVGNPLRPAPTAPPVMSAGSLEWNQPAVPGGVARAPSAYPAATVAQEPTPQTVTRPQPTERPREIILEWSRGGQPPSYR